MKGISEIVAADTTGGQEMGKDTGSRTSRHTMRLSGPTNRTPNDWMRAEQELVRHYA